MATSSHADIPTLSQIRNETQRVFGRRPCLWQLKAAQAILKNDKDVICISGTGSGKTLTFWMPLLFRKKHIQIVITPLNILGKQNVDQLTRVGINAISITRDTATPQNFKDIGDGCYRAVVVNPEILLMNGGQFEALWKNKPFVARLLSFIWDEAHCVKTWSDFRGQYKEASRLRYLIPRNIPFFLASATLPPPVLDDVMTILQIRRDQCELIQRSNDRPNIHIAVRKIQHSLTSYEDLSFLIPENWTRGQPVPPKFVVFFDNIPDSMAAVDYLRSRLPEEYREKIRWFNADMTGDYREDEIKNMMSGDTWGLCCTDSFGMGVDLPDIKIVVQWRASCSMCTLWQRFGRGARDQSLTAKAIFLLEPKFFDEEKHKKAEAKIKRAEKVAVATKRKAEEELESARKVAVTGTSSANRRALPVHASHAVDETDSDKATTLPEQAPEPNTTRVWSIAQCAERRYLYNQHSEKPSGKALTATDRDELEPALDDMVNAASRPWKCFRAPLMVYFGNDKFVSSHEDCSPTGCTRCALPSPSIPQVCCELCTPSAFSDIIIPAPIVPPKRAAVPPPKGAHRFKRDFKMNRHDADLQRDLHEFRKQEMLSRYGAAMANNLGPSAIMSDEVLERIVACAHAGRIETVEHLRHEVKWINIGKYGAQIIDMVKKHRAGTDASDAPRTTVAQGAGDAIESRPALAVISPQMRSSEIAKNGRRGTAPGTMVALGVQDSIESFPVLVAVSPPVRGSGGGVAGGSGGAEDGVTDVSDKRSKDAAHPVQKRKCSKCGVTGHISSNRRCPFYSHKRTPNTTSKQRGRAVLPVDQNEPPGSSAAPGPSLPRRHTSTRTLCAPSLDQPTAELSLPISDPLQPESFETSARSLPMMPYVPAAMISPPSDSSLPQDSAAPATGLTLPRAASLPTATEHLAITPLPTMQFYATHRQQQQQ